jgi:hypothetical protein
MAKYIVEQMATVWYRIEVEAENEVEAQEQATNLIISGEGEEMYSSFEWQDQFYIEELDGEEI